MARRAVAGVPLIGGLARARLPAGAAAQPSAPAEPTLTIEEDALERSAEDVKTPGALEIRP